MYNKSPSKQIYNLTKEAYKNLVLSDLRFYKRPNINQSNNGGRFSKNQFANDGSSEVGNRRHCCNKKFCWWNPAMDSIPVVFCMETSIHGLRYLGQARRHLTERLFWVLAFIFSLFAAVYLIYGVWHRYQDVPVTVSFQSREEGIDTIPFPAVTLCDVNTVSEEIGRELYSIITNGNPAERSEARLKILYAGSLCHAHDKFSKNFIEMTYDLNDEENSFTIVGDSQMEMIDYLLNNTYSCEKLIRKCFFRGDEYNCSALFHATMTDFGKCCTFNMLPLPLLLKNPMAADGDIFNNPVLGNKSQDVWNPEEVKLWTDWKHDAGVDLADHLIRPWRQHRAGIPYGLSVLLEPNLARPFCPLIRKGVRFSLHSALETPRVTLSSALLDLGKEILVKVHPDVTQADDDIREINSEKRKCSFSIDRTLKFYSAYTDGNCMEECTAIFLGMKCNCTYYFMPRADGVGICNTELNSKDSKCIDKSLDTLEDHFHEHCQDCDTLCEDVKYEYQTNTVEFYPEVDYIEYGPNGEFNETARKMKSMVHIFFDKDMFVPKLRKRLYGTTDLIANTGGILGLCLGVSVLSVAEIVYFFTIRSCWSYCKTRRIAVKLMRKISRRGHTTVIHVNPKLFGAP